MIDSNQLLAEARALEAQAGVLREQAVAARQQALEAQPLADRLVYAAHTRCHCGAGMAYDPAGKVHSPGDTPLRRPNAWECSTILRYYGGDLTADEAEQAKAAEHDEALSFTCYEIKSEGQPSAIGATTRPAKAA